MEKFIDISFDFRRDTPFGKDPDALSPTLRKYHKFLWSKQLPSGQHFELEDTHNNTYLYHKSALGEYSLSSDSAIHTFSTWKSMAHIIQQLDDDEVEAFQSISYTMGGMILFPANRVNGKATINGARGFHPLIKDRIDLTLECIRRHYISEISPLTEVLARYKEFFAIFGNFKGYVDFFLLQDLVDDDFSSIKFLMLFDDFKTPTVPKNLEFYISYKEKTIKFVNNRNLRILESI